MASWIETYRRCPHEEVAVIFFGFSSKLLEGLSRARQVFLAAASACGLCTSPPRRSVRLVGGRPFMLYGETVRRAIVGYHVPGYVVLLLLYPRAKSHMTITIDN